VEQLIRLLATALRPRNVEVFLCCRQGGFPEGPLVEGAHCLEVGDIPCPRILRDRTPERRIIRFCSENAIELAHAHGAYRAAFAAQRVRRALGLSYVVTTHGELDPAYLPRQGFLFRNKVRRMLHDADRVTFASPHMERYVDRFCDTSSKGRQIDNCIDLSWWRQSPPAGPGDYVLSIGSLSRQKGHIVLVDALRRLADHGPRLHLVIAGEGSQKPVLEERARSLGLALCHDRRELSRAETPTVCLPGYARGEAKRELFAECLFFAFPSQVGEGQPLVLLEAMASGKAILASDLPCARALVTPGVNGELVPPLDPAAWADAMKALLADTERRRRYEKRLLSQAEKHDVNLVAEQYAALYREVLGPEGSR
jgi:glycosyltransferase involved in cell wall biosynthesis